MIEELSRSNGSNQQASLALDSQDNRNLALYVTEILVGLSLTCFAITFAHSAGWGVRKCVMIGSSGIVSVGVALFLTSVSGNSSKLQPFDNSKKIEASSPYPSSNQLETLLGKEKASMLLDVCHHIKKEFKCQIDLMERVWKTDEFTEDTAAIADIIRKSESKQFLQAYILLKIHRSKVEPEIKDALRYVHPEKIPALFQPLISFSAASARPSEMIRMIKVLSCYPNQTIENCSLFYKKNMCTLYPADAQLALLVLLARSGRKERNTIFNKLKDAFGESYPSWGVCNAEFGKAASAFVCHPEEAHKELYQLAKELRGEISLSQIVTLLQMLAFVPKNEWQYFKALYLQQLKVINNASFAKAFELLVLTEMQKGREGIFEALKAHWKEIFTSGLSDYFPGMYCHDLLMAAQELALWLSPRMEELHLDEEDEWVLRKRVEWVLSHTLSNESHRMMEEAFRY